MSIDLLDLVAVFPPFTGAAGPPTGVVPDADNFLEAVRTRLRETPGLADLTDVYLTTAKPGAPYPYLVMTQVDSNDELTTEDSYIEHIHMQYDVLTLDAAAAERLGVAAYRALSWRPGNPLLSFAGGYEIVRLPIRRGAPRAEPGGMPGGETVWRWSFEFEHQVGRE